MAAEEKREKAGLMFGKPLDEIELLAVKASLRSLLERIMKQGAHYLVVANPRAGVLPFVLGSAAGNVGEALRAFGKPDGEIPRVFHRAPAVISSGEIADYARRDPSFVKSKFLVLDDQPLDDGGLRTAPEKEMNTGLKALFGARAALIEAGVPPTSIGGGVFFAPERMDLIQEKLRAQFLGRANLGKRELAASFVAGLHVGMHVNRKQRITTIIERLSEHGERLTKSVALRKEHLGMHGSIAGKDTHAAGMETMDGQLARVSGDVAKGFARELPAILERAQARRAPRPPQEPRATAEKKAAAPKEPPPKPKKPWWHLR